MSVRKKNKKINLLWGRPARKKPRETVHYFGTARFFSAFKGFKAFPPFTPYYPHYPTGFPFITLIIPLVFPFLPPFSPVFLFFSPLFPLSN
jgi:hypothetical protein